MMRFLHPLLALTATTALAEAPRVATDIAPVHGLAARVMEGVGAPDVIVPPGASPHDFALRPSQARALQQADLVIWTGHDLTPWLESTIESLSYADVLELNDLPGTHLLAWRDTGEEADGDHDHDHGHDHGPTDPHSWLDPDNAKLWTRTIAEALAALDPDGAAAYRANAIAAETEIDAAAAQVEALLAPHRGALFVVYHDAYHYFEAHFDMHAVATVAESDAADPGPSHLRTLQARIAAQGIVCLFTEPQFDTGLVETLAETGPARIGVLDPLGTALETGPAFYPALLVSMAEAMAGCLQKK